MKHELGDGGVLVIDAASSLRRRSVHTLVTDTGVAPAITTA